MNLHEKLIELRRQVPYLQKDTKGYNYSYVSGSSVLEKLQPKMNELGVALLTETGPLTKETVTAENDKGKITSQTQVYASFRFTWVDAETGEKIALDFCGAGQDSDISKAVGKMLTYTERYFLLKSLNVPTDSEDPDAHQAAQKPEPKTPAQMTREEAEKYPIPSGSKKGQPAASLTLDEITQAIQFLESKPVSKSIAPFLTALKILEMPF